MKKSMFILVAAFLFTAFTREDARADVNFNFFYSSLSPYGEWIELDYDLIVWKPYGVERSWRPYAHGRWIWSSHGWYWDSFEDFGWATYHYGRWYDDDYYGWVWIPDYEWGPSWVEWRYGDDYIGWAPLPPYAYFDIHIGVRFSFDWISPYRYWNFVTYRNFCHNDVNIYIIDNSTNVNIYNRTKYRTNYNYRNGRIFNGGVDRGYVERRSGYRLAEREIFTTDNFQDYKRRSNQSDRIEAYRPSRTDVEKTREINRTSIKKGDHKTDIVREKVAMSTERTNNNDLKVKRNGIREDGKQQIRTKSGSADQSVRSKNGSVNKTQKRSANNSTKKESTQKPNPVKKEDRSVNKRQSSKDESSLRSIPKSQGKSSQNKSSIRKPTTNKSKPAAKLNRSTSKSSTQKQKVSKPNQQSKNMSSKSTKSSSKKEAKSGSRTRTSNTTKSKIRK